MIKTIKIGEREVTLSNNVGWAITYRDQFGHDIISTIIPLIASMLDVLGGLVEETGKTENIQVKDFIKVLDSDKLIDAVIHASGLEFVELINITWALAKCYDDNLPEPKKWVQEFEEFPVDVIAPEVFSMIAKGVVSSKNLERVLGILPKNPSTQTQSSSQDSNED